MIDRPFTVNAGPLAGMQMSLDEVRALPYSPDYGQDEPSPWEPGGEEFERLYAEYRSEYKDDLCLSFRNGEHERLDGTIIWHFDKDCGAPHCPYYVPAQKMPVELVTDHSLGNRDQLLSHIQRCADRSWSYEELYEEAYRVEVALRPGEPWTDKDLVPMIIGALEKAPAHIAENNARSDAEYALLASMGITPKNHGPAATGPAALPLTRRPGKKRIQWPQ